MKSPVHQFLSFVLFSTTDYTESVLQDKPPHGLGCFVIFLHGLECMSLSVNYSGTVSSIKGDVRHDHEEKKKGKTKGKGFPSNAA